MASVEMNGVHTRSDESYLCSIYTVHNGHDGPCCRYASQYAIMALKRKTKVPPVVLNASREVGFSPACGMCSRGQLVGRNRASVRTTSTTPSTDLSQPDLSHFKIDLRGNHYGRE